MPSFVPRLAGRRWGAPLAALALTGMLCIGGASASPSPSSGGTAAATGAATSGGPSAQQLSWAREALRERGTLEVVAADPRSGLITVRVATARTQSAAPGRVLLSGPGYRIETAAGAVTAPAAAGPVATAETGGANLASPPVERRRHPIICQGARLLHIDGANLEFDGNALTVEDGCEVHITNSRITAKGVAILARRASVHIDNSAIAGTEGSIDATDGAQVYARSSTFAGLIRHEGTAGFHDLGGNAGD